MLLLVFATILIFVQPSAGLFSATPVGDFHLENGQYVPLRSSKEFPYVVQIELFGAHLCGGALIRRGIVITAAHCFESTNPSGLKVRAGHLYKGAMKAPGLQTSHVAWMRKHKHAFDKVINGQNEVYFDLALVKLSEPFKLTQYVNIVKLAPEGTEEQYKGQDGLVLGWGTTEDGKLASALKKVQLTVFSAEQCAAAVGMADYAPILLCAKNKHNRGGFGSGDSGGPFVKHFPGNPENDELMGVVSFGYDKRKYPRSKETVPNEERPSISSNIAVFRSWIEQMIVVFQEVEKKQGKLRQSGSI